MNRDFKGIWIPREIWNHPNLIPLEKILWAEIHSLHCREKKGCFASNTYFAEKLKVSDRYIREMISNLKKLLLVTDVSFNGRTRIIRANLPVEDFDTIEELPIDVEASSGLPGTPVPGWEEPQFRSHHIEDKEDITKNTPPIPPHFPTTKKEPPLAEGASPRVAKATEKKVKPSLDSFSAEALETTEKLLGIIKRAKPDYLVTPHSEFQCLVFVDYMLRLDKRSATRIISTFSWALADDFWHPLMFKPNPAKYLRTKFDELEKRMNQKPINKNKVDRRTKNMDGTPVSTPWLDNLF